MKSSILYAAIVITMIVLASITGVHLGEIRADLY